MGRAEKVSYRAGGGTSLAHRAHTVRVLAGTEYKLRYSGSALGYFWSIAKPLAFFSVLYVVFGRALRFGVGIENYPLYLLLGVVLFTYFADATNSTVETLVNRSQLLRRLSFPRMIIPISVTVTVFITLCINLVAVVVFVAAARVVPQLDWIAVVPLLLELYLFVLGVSLILSTLYVYFRDIRQIWEVLLQILFYAAPVIYPLQLLPSWGQHLAFLNPITQIMQDFRALVLDSEQAPTVATVYGHSAMRLVPIATVLAIFALGVAIFKSREPWLAERV